MADTITMDEFVRRLEELGLDVDAFMDTEVKKLAAEAIKQVRNRTPWETGHLRRNIFVEIVGGGTRNPGAHLYTNVFYAPYVEYGHRQKPGRYVPAIGKRLKKSWVTGKFMFTDGIDATMRKAPAGIQKDLEHLISKDLG